MDDVERRAHLVRGLVRGVQPGEDLAADRDRDVDRDMRLGFVRRAQQPVQRRAVDVLLDEDHLLAGRDDVEHRHDVAVVDLRRDAGFVEEHRDEVAILGELGVQPLGCDDPAEPLVAHQPGDVDRGHATPRDLGGATSSGQW